MKTDLIGDAAAYVSDVDRARNALLLAINSDPNVSPHIRAGASKAISYATDAVIRCAERREKRKEGV